jgi:hypothetical protein
VPFFPSPLFPRLPELSPTFWEGHVINIVKSVGAPKFHPICGQAPGRNHKKRPEAYEGKTKAIRKQRILGNSPTKDHDLSLFIIHNKMWLRK